MKHLTRYAQAPSAFCLFYVRRHLVAHVLILAAVIGAVTASVSTQYGVKYLVDTLSRHATASNDIWLAFAFLVALIMSDNLLWRVAGWISNYAFVAVTGDLRSDLFRYLTGHAPSYFADRQPGMLSSRITATSNAVFTMENMMVWNVLPPCAATLGAVAFLSTISIPITVVAIFLAGGLCFVLFRLAAAGRPLHHGFADRAAAVDGELVDIISNMPLVRAFGGLHHEFRRFDKTVESEMVARRRSLVYLEKLRLFHSVITIALTIALLAWIIVLWKRGQATNGDVVLVCTLGFTILHATRDLAVALVDVTQHMARLSEAVATLLVPHDICDRPDAVKLIPRRGAVQFDNISFAYPNGRHVFSHFKLRLEAGQRVGMIGESGSGKSTLFALLQRFYDLQDGRILIDGESISSITQESLHQAMAIVPQDISLFHRSVMENIRYGKPDATDDQVFEAAAAAECLDFILALPDGFATIVGDRGVKLSGGQRQRIAIARALLKDAPILLLDEATSSLDSESEEAIRQALDRLMRGRTVIAIAHRLSTLRGFDRIVVLQEGKVIQDGTPDQLLRAKGSYRDLVLKEMTRLSPNSVQDEKMAFASAG
ncbi:MAG TPA: ABC transporter ATP-binding protein [Terriglobia bacterium]|nr:ABC transporter ATP-binding protein [Terriglobia bacterium]